MATNLQNLLPDLDGGIFEQKISTMLSDVALGVVTHGRQGKITIEFDLQQIGETQQVNCKHNPIQSPASRGFSFHGIYQPHSCRKFSAAGSYRGENGMSDGYQQKYGTKDLITKLHVMTHLLASDGYTDETETAAMVAEEVERLHAERDRFRAELERLRAGASVALEAIQCTIQDAYNNAYMACCGGGGQECCGCPEPAWDAADQAIMDTLGPIEKQLREAIKPQPQAVESEPFQLT